MGITLQISTGIIWNNPTLLSSYLTLINQKLHYIDVFLSEFSTSVKFVKIWLNFSTYLTIKLNNTEMLVRPQKRFDPT